MSDSTFTWLIFGGAAAIWIAWAVAAVLRRRRELAGVRLVECPETRALAAVTLDRLNALMVAITDRPPDARLASCSRWAERGRCDQPCLPQACDSGSSVDALIQRWVEHRRCALCGGALLDAAAVGHHFALRSNAGVTTEWPDLDPLTLPSAFRTKQAVCWNCHIAETFRRQYPELVTDR